MHNFKANYDKILEVLKSLDLESENFLFQIRKPRLSDLEIVALNLTSEYMSIDSEYQLFRILPSDIKSLIERSVYNRRKRRLFIHMERIRKLLAEKFNGSEKYFIVDSMPLEVCKLSRSSRSKICRETDYAIPNKGYCASQKMHYYGYKLHAVCSAEGVFQSLDISPASVHDIHYLGDLGDQREMLKGTQRKLYSVANTLGISGDTIRMVERRARQDKWIFWTGVVVLFVFCYFVLRWLR